MSAPTPDPVAQPNPPNRPHLPTPDILDQARTIVDGRRHDEYGQPERNLTRIGQAWAALLGQAAPIPPDHVALMLAALKLVRATGRQHDDDLTDAAGYILLAHRARITPSNKADEA